MVHQYSRLEEKLNNYTINGECWEYNGCTNNYGYCPLMVKGKWSYVHRFAYEHYYGKIPKGMTVDHICFNRKCINPKHLRLLTRGENGKRHAHSQGSEYCSICGEKKAWSEKLHRRWCRKCAARRAQKHRDKARNANG